MMKRLSPKGKMDNRMWQRVARGMDNVNKAIVHCKNLLHIDTDESTRITPLESEIVKYRAKLRELRYFSKDDDYFCNMDGDKEMNTKLQDFAALVTGKREVFFRRAQTTPLQNIRYPVINPFGDDLNEALESEADELIEDHE